MNTWAPLFSKIVDSSLWTLPDWVCKIFITMLAKKDSDHVVRGNAFQISRWAFKTEQEVLDALKILNSPDKKRIEPQLYDGKRIEKHPDGWLILNGQLYEDLMRSTNRREYMKNYQRQRRAKKKIESPYPPSTPLKGEAAFCKVDDDYGAPHSDSLCESYPEYKSNGQPTASEASA